MFKYFVGKRLEKYVRKYFAKHPDIKLVAIAGSVGKTSTKIAIATVLSQRLRVRVHGGNHNDSFSTPLAVLGITYPENAKGFKVWSQILREAKARVNGPSDVDVVIQELGSERIGQTLLYGKYLNPDIAVITAVASEHMDHFKTIEAVAHEELAVANYSKSALINCDDVPGNFSSFIKNANISLYGTSDGANYQFLNMGYTFEDGYVGTIKAPNNASIEVKINLIGEHTVRSAVAAAAVAYQLGMDPADIVGGMARIKPVPGRMNILRGVKESIIIDDTYNSSPSAAISSIETLYKLPKVNRIIVLGNMNNLGKTSAEEHEKVGRVCDPNELAWVVTVGDDAEKYLAPAAKARGCQVKSFRNSLEAGAFVNSVITDGSIVLFKGSEDGIFLEEAVKNVLHRTSDEVYLVRQSSAWKNFKAKFFSKFK